MPFTSITQPQSIFTRMSRTGSDDNHSLHGLYLTAAAAADDKLVTLKRGYQSHLPTIGIHLNKFLLGLVDV